MTTNTPQQNDYYVHTSTGVYNLDNDIGLTQFIIDTSSKCNTVEEAQNWDYLPFVDISVNKLHKSKRSHAAVLKLVPHLEPESTLFLTSHNGKHSYEDAELFSSLKCKAPNSRDDLLFFNFYSFYRQVLFSANRLGALTKFYLKGRPTTSKIYTYWSSLTDKNVLCDIATKARDYYTYKLSKAKNNSASSLIDLNIYDDKDLSQMKYIFNTFIADFKRTILRFKALRLKDMYNADYNYSRMRLPFELVFKEFTEYPTDALGGDEGTCKYSVRVMLKIRKEISSNRKLCNGLIMIKCS